MNLVKKVSSKLVCLIRGVTSPIPSVITDAEYKALRKVPPFTQSEGHVYGQRVTFSDIVGFLHSVKEIFGEDVYRFNSSNSAPHIIDAGANIGLSVIYFKRLYPAATIIAYEPDADIFKLLSRNVQGYTGVEIREAAAWTENTTLSFYSEGSLAGSSKIDFLGKGVEQKVAAVRLKDELSKRHVDFLKLDIEGAENSVLFDIEEELDNVGLLFFEYHSQHDKPQKLGDILNMIRSKGFRYIINGAHGPRLPFVEKVPHGFDLQLNVSCFRD